MKNCSFKFLYTILLLLLSWEASAQQDNLYAGFRASRVNDSYPGNQFPDEDYWISVGEGISQKFENSAPASIWLVSLYQGNGKTRVGFPYYGKNFSNVLYTDKDLNEEYLTRFDAEGFKVYLQVEPGDANVDTLIIEILTRYAHHPCVAGFGIDVEWLNPEKFSDGKKVTNEEAMRWEAIVKSFNPGYKLFLKHYFYEWMPSTYRGDILFVDDGQQFTSLNAMLNNFKEWADNLKGSKVAYQYGYPSDKVWWDTYPDPAKTIGKVLVDNIPTTAGLFWVDFSITSIFPMVTTSVRDENIEQTFELYQNYPNPFNPETSIQYAVPPGGHLSTVKQMVSIKIYDILGNEITTLVNEEKEAGKYKLMFNAAGLTSGIYFYKLTVNGNSGDFTETKRMLLLK